jgi:hypothetical protein
MMILSKLPPLISLLTFTHALQNVKDQVPISLSEDTCMHPASKTHLISTSPLVIYISDFLTPAERQHLISITQVPYHHHSYLSPPNLFSTRLTPSQKRLLLQFRRRRPSRSTGLKTDEVLEIDIRTQG